MEAPVKTSTPPKRQFSGPKGGGKIPDEFIRDLLDRVDIVDVVGGSVPLKKNGQNYSGCCPFHDEKTASFTVSQQKQFFHCFGCGAHGDAIKFLIDKNGVSFIDAVKDLAGQVGMELPKGNATAPAPSERVNPVLFQRMLEASDYYRSQLCNNQRALDYLAKRGIKPLTAVRFGVGYAPAGWQNLQSIFGGYDAVELQMIGLVIKSPQGRHYDRFRDRIMIPILSANADVIGFGGRVIGSEEPKYLNSPESPLFDKGSELFGLPQAFPVIRDKGSVVVVEGYMDAIALSEAGIRNAVATLGTATTANHARKLFRVANRVFFCFDGDAAGRKAAWRAMENSLPYLADNKSASFVFLPAEEDPDSFVRSHGKRAFAELCQAAIPLSDYLIRVLIKRNKPESAEGKAKFVFEARPYISKLRVPQAELLRLQVLKQVSGITQFSVEELSQLCPPEVNGNGSA